MITLMLAFTVISFFIGALAGRTTAPEQKLIKGTVPMKTLIADFEDFARGFENGELSEEADAAIKMLKAHAEQKFLPASKDKNTKKPRTWDGDDNNRKNDWCDMRCYEKEMASASNDDERLTIIRRWMRKYVFTTRGGWQTWSIQQMSSSSARDKLRMFFDEQDV